MREPPKIASEIVKESTVWKVEQLDMKTQVREYRLITPLFGGGVTPHEPDPVTVIRGTEIRAHLRFWWRATRGGQFGGKLEEMKKAEDAIWGKAYEKKDKGLMHEGIVQVVVEPVPGTGRREAPFMA